MADNENGAAWGMYPWLRFKNTDTGYAITFTSSLSPGDHELHVYECLSGDMDHLNEKWFECSQPNMMYRNVLVTVEPDVDPEWYSPIEFTCDSLKHSYNTDVVMTVDKVSYSMARVRVVGATEPADDVVDSDTDALVAQCCAKLTAANACTRRAAVDRIVSAIARDDTVTEYTSDILLAHII